MKNLIPGLLLSLLLLSSGMTEANAQSRVEYVPLGSASAAIYRPQAATDVAVIIIHRTANTMNAAACRELAARGFMAVCISPEQNDEARVEWERVMQDVNAGIVYARKQPGIARVVLWGHSGGGAAMASYQAMAEKGAAYCGGSIKLVPCSAAMTHLTPADGVILLDAHPGDPVMDMRNLDPAVSVGVDGKLHVDPKLDPFSAANGFDPSGSHYTQEFLDRYTHAQAKLTNDLIAKAQASEKAMREAGMTRPQQDWILVPTSIMSGWLSRINSDHDDSRTTLRPQKLLRNDGTVHVELIVSTDITASKAIPGFTTQLWTTKSFLESHAVVAHDSVGDIDYCTANTTPICAVKYMTVPVLIISMGAYLYPRDSERLLEQSASPDKDMVVLKGQVIRSSHAGLARRRQVNMTIR